MADIIRFIPRKRSDSRPAGGMSAVVVIFPGVRYERAGEDTRDGEPRQRGERPGGRRSRRRRLS